MSSLDTARALTVSDGAHELIENLEGALDEWGAKLPGGKAELAEADRILRLDKRPLDEALAVLRWATRDEFWRPNVRSMAKFRKQYDTLRGQMQRRPSTGNNAAARLESSVQDDLEEARRLRAEGR